MKLFGLTISRAKQEVVEKAPSNLNTVSDRSWWPIVRESFTGAWQKNITVDQQLVLSYHAVYACMTLIASDIAKLRVKLVEQDDNGIWTEVANHPAFGPILRQPNGIQNRIQFWENWILSKLMRGNTYVLKVRDNRNVVVALKILDPNRVKPLISTEGAVFYQLMTDNIAGLTEDITVPAREIIHDRFNCLFHPLVGTSPIYAAGVAATQGLNIQNNSAYFFKNRSQPSGILTAPGPISDETAARLKAAWDSNYSGDNAGKTAVVGDGLQYTAITMSAQESQMIEQLKWTSEVVCSVFHVPSYKVGLGPLPSYNNVQALNTEYYSQALQSLIEAAELCLDEGLGLDSPKDAKRLGTEFDLDGLLRMDSVTQMTVLKEGISAAVLSPNEARRKMDLKPVEGGNSPFLQQQNYSLQALAKRDAQADPFATAQTPTPAAVEAPANDNAAQKIAALYALRKGLA